MTTGSEVHSKGASYSPLNELPFELLFSFLRPLQAKISGGDVKLDSDGVVREEDALDCFPSKN